MAMGTSVALVTAVSLPQSCDQLRADGSEYVTHCHVSNDSTFEVWFSCNKPCFYVPCWDDTLKLTYQKEERRRLQMKGGSERMEEILKKGTSIMDGIM